jgi:cytochrome c
MAAARFNWSADKLDAFLAKPRAVVPGTSMVFAGMPDAASRAALIAFLATQR